MGTGRSRMGTGRPRIRRGGTIEPSQHRTTDRNTGWHAGCRNTDSHAPGRRVSPIVEVSDGCESHVKDNDQRNRRASSRTRDSGWNRFVVPMDHRRRDSYRCTRRRIPTAEPEPDIAAGTSDKRPRDNESRPSRRYLAPAWRKRRGTNKQAPQRYATVDSLDYLRLWPCDPNLPVPTIYCDPSAAIKNGLMPGRCGYPSGNVTPYEWPAHDLARRSTIAHR